MKITSQDQSSLESAMEREAVKMGAENLPDFFRRVQEDEPDRFARAKSPAVLACSFLVRGEALAIVCDKIYCYADDSHLATFHKALFRKHS